LSLPQALATASATLAALCVGIFTATLTLATRFPWLRLQTAARRGVYSGLFFLGTSILTLVSLQLSLWHVESIAFDAKIVLPIHLGFEIVAWAFFATAVLGLLNAVWIVHRFVF